MEDDESVFQVDDMRRPELLFPLANTSSFTHAYGEQQRGSSWCKDLVQPSVHNSPGFVESAGDGKLEDSPLQERNSFARTIGNVDDKNEEGSLWAHY